MLPDEKTIKSRSIKVYETLMRLMRCTFDELQAHCHLKNIDLCLSIAHLMKEKKIRQERDADKVYYCLYA